MKKRVVLIVVIFFFVLVAGIFYGMRTPNSAVVLPPAGVSFSKQTPRVFVSPTPSSGIRVGITTSVDLVALKGGPVETKSENGLTILSYPTKNKYWNDEYFFKNDILMFVRERVFPLSKDSYATRVGTVNEAPIVLYGPDARSGILLYSFPEKGISYLANKNSGFVYEAWIHPREPINKLLVLPQFQNYSLTEMFGKEGVPE